MFKLIAYAIIGSLILLWLIKTSLHDATDIDEDDFTGIDGVDKD